MKRIIACVFLLSVAAVTPPARAAGISNIGTFLDQCPTLDPAFGTISSDFQIRHDGVVAPTPACSEPVSAMPTSQYTDELIVLQTLRTIYYMDRGMSGHLPWTSGTLYDWMRSKIGGIDIRDDISAGGSCCYHYSGSSRTFIRIAAENDSNRDFDRTWRGIAGNIDFYAHETRHVDGFPHVSCCGINNGCDQSFDTSNLTPYGIQWWLNKLWLEGTINVGYACLSPSEVQETTNWFLSALGSFRSRFCTDQPAIVSAPAEPGGACPATSTCTADATHLCLTGNRFRVSVQWTNYNTGVTAAAHATPFVDESGFFYFQDPANIEIMVKVHDACAGYGHFWFFSAATTNVGYTITVVDTKSGQTETYSNPAHVLSAANTDQASFGNCP